MKKQKETRWVITYHSGLTGTGKPGLYTGQWLTRKSAIEHHTKAFGNPWRECFEKGDRCIKATIIF